MPTIEWILCVSLAKPQKIKQLLKSSIDKLPKKRVVKKQQFNVNSNLSKISNHQLTWYVAASKLVNATNNKLFCKQYKPLGTINLTVSYGFPRISSLKALHDFLTEKFCWASKLIIQTVNLQHSFNMTAVDGKYGGPGLVLEYLKSNTCKKKDSHVWLLFKKLALFWVTFFKVSFLR